MLVPTEPPAIPPLPGEGGRPYLAFATYATLGHTRSLSKTCAVLGAKPGYVRQLERWSTAFHWQERTSAYDTAMAAHVAQHYTASYAQELEAHRQRYKKVGKDLCTVAQGLLGQLARSVQGKTIKGEDGNEYVIPTIKLMPDTLSTVARALLVAADLEAHALNLDKLLPLLSADEGV